MINYVCIQKCKIANDNDQGSPRCYGGHGIRKLDGESNAGFIVTAMRGEIARRQAEGSGENPLVSSLDALAKVEQIGIKAAEEIGQLVAVAREELQRRKAKESE